MAANVFLTADVECGDFCESYEGSVFGRIGDQPGRNYGLEYILETLRKYGLKCTFFVETFISSRLGIEGLQNACKKILEYDQEVQLHIHPNLLSDPQLLHLDYAKLPAHLWKYSYDEQVRIIEHGKQILSNCGVTETNAFRAGGFGADNSTVKALKENNINIDSSYNLSYRDSSCRLDAGGGNVNDIMDINDVVEIPVTNFRVKYMPWVKPRHMQISAVSFGEMRSVLSWAESNDIKSVCILFHSNEFISFGNRERSEGVPNTINMNRFEQLCKYISKNKERFRTVKVSGLEKGDKIKGGDMNKIGLKLPLVTPLDWGTRVFQQVWKRRFN